MKLRIDQKKTLETSEQWWLSRDSIGPSVVSCYDAIQTGMTKHYGCVEYRPINHSATYTYILIDGVEAYFGHCPPKEGLIYVEKQDDGTWSCETIELELSD